MLTLVAAVAIAGAVACAEDRANNSNIRVVTPAAERGGMDRFHEVQGATAPPSDLPDGRLIIRGAKGVDKAIQQPAISGYQWVINGSQITDTDETAQWPKPIMAHPGDDIIIQLHGRHLPAAIEISAYRSLDPDRVAQEYGADFYCYSLTGVQETCDLHILNDANQSDSWQGVIPQPQESGPYYLVVWAEWFDFTADQENRPRGRYHITWRFLVHHADGP